MCRVHPIRPELSEGEVYRKFLLLRLQLLFSMPSPTSFRLPYSFPTFCFVMQHRSHQYWVMVLKQACLFLEILHTEGSLLLFNSRLYCWSSFLYDACSCCVDEVAAEHVQAECIIHFGPACLTQYVNRTTSITVYDVNGSIIWALQWWKYSQNCWNALNNASLYIIAFYF